MLLQPRRPIPGYQRRRVLVAGEAELPTAGLLADWYAGNGVETPSWMTLDTGNNNQVQVWEGTDGTTIDMATTSFGAQPKWEQSVAGLGGRGGVYFDGGDYMGADNASLIASLTTHTAYIVYSGTEATWTPLGKTASLYSEGNTGSLTPFWSAKTNDEIDGQFGFDMRSSAGVVISMLSGDLNLDDGNPHLLVVRRVASNDWRMRVDGVEVATGTSAPGSTSINKLALGCLWRSSRDHFLKGYLGRVRLYSVDNYADVEPILADFYGI